jgi:hypothetical protein
MTFVSSGASTDMATRFIRKTRRLCDEDHADAHFTGPP